MSWTQTVSIEKLAGKKPALFKHGAKQIALFRSDDRVFAFDNRCPHEGYPLREGSIDGECVLTCNWHNWKFRLSDGHNLLGDDHLRVYPTRIEEDQVWVDFSEKPKELLLEESKNAMLAAFKERQYDRMARILTKMSFDGLDLLDVVREAVNWSHNRFQWGMTHAFAALADWLTLYDFHKGNRELRVLALTETLDHIAHDSLRYPEFPFPETQQTYSESAFLEAIENEDETAAIELLNGALVNGLHFGDLRKVLARAALAHYNDFGHSLIYVHKAGEVIGWLGTTVERGVLRALVRSLVYATREDLLPEFRQYAPALETALDIPLSTQSVGSLNGPYGLSVNKSLDWVNQSLQSHQPEAVYASLIEAASLNLLTFDLTYQHHTELPVSKNRGWLSVTHAVTFANALRELAGDDEVLWRPGLLQLACFTGRITPFVQPDDYSSWMIEDTDSFFEQALQQIYDHGQALPIFSCHLLKTTAAVREEINHLPDTVNRLLLGGLNRFLNEPIKAKHVRRTVKQAIALVSRDYSESQRGD